MEKKLTTKIQKIVPKLEDNSQNIAKALIIEPDDELILEKKGTIYTIFDINSRKNLDVMLVTKVVNDVLHDAYYQAEGASPIQSIEKAILKLRDKVTQLANEPTDGNPMVSFSIVTAILWGSTVYIVQYGNTHAYLMREGNVKPVNAATEGSFAVASGVIKDNDVVILATEEFTRRFPPDKLIGTGQLQTEDLGMLEAGMIMKFSIIKTFSESEIVDFGAKNSTMNVNKQTKGAPGVAPSFGKSSKNIQEIKKKTPRSLPKINKTFSIVALLVVLIISGVLYAVYKMDGKVTENTKEVEQIVQNRIENTNRENNEIVVDEEQDRINRVTRIEPNVFYDLKLTDETARASKMTLVGETLVISDSNTNKIYTSNINTPQFNEIDSALEDVNEIISYKDLLGVAGNNGFSAVNLENNAIVENYELEGLGLVDTYLEFIYSLSTNTITKYEITEGVIDESVWAQNEILNKASSMAVNVSIYILKGDDLLKFTTGVLEDFTVEGMDKGFDDPVKIITNVELDNIYIADTGNNRIVVLSDEGVLRRQYLPNIEDVWTDIRDIAVSDDEQKLFVLDGDTVYEVDLVQNVITEENGEEAGGDATENEDTNAETETTTTDTTTN